MKKVILATALLSLVAVPVSSQLFGEPFLGFNAEGSSLTVPWWTEAYEWDLAKLDMDVALQLTQPNNRGFVRLSLSWRGMENQQGVIDFSTMDKYVVAAKQRGLEIIFTINSIPAWANNSFGCSFWQGGCSNPPASAQYFYDFALAVAQRYASDAWYWELWNEPDLNVFWGGSMSQLKTTILTPGRNAILSVDPNARFISPGFVSSSSKMTQLLNITAGYWDYAGIHVYDKNNQTYNRFRQLVNNKWTNARNACNNNNKFLPFWVTEAGINSATIAGGEQGQADLLYDIILGFYYGDIHAEKWTIHTIRDQPPSNGIANGVIKTTSPANTVPITISLKPSYTSVSGAMLHIFLNP